MALENGAPHSSPHWFVSPGEGDLFAWIALGFLALAIYGVVVLYAAFDRWADNQAHGTPLAKTIPTMLTIALLYELFPLGHFNILLPVAAILIALMADWSRFHLQGGMAGLMSRGAEGTTQTPDASPNTGSAEEGERGNV